MSTGTPLHWQPVHVDDGCLCWPNDTPQVVVAPARPPRPPHCPSGILARWRCANVGRCDTCGCARERRCGRCRSGRCVYCAPRCSPIEVAER